MIRGSHATAAGPGSQRGSRKSEGESSVAWSWVPDKSRAPKSKIQQSSSPAWEDVPPGSGKTSSDNPGSEANLWRTRASSRKTSVVRPASTVRSGSSRRTGLNLPPQQSSGGDARPKGRSGHRPGQGPRPVDLQPNEDDEKEAGDKQPQEDAAMEGKGGGGGGDEHDQQAEKGKRPPPPPQL